MNPKIIYVGHKNRLITFNHQPNMGVRTFIESNKLGLYWAGTHEPLLTEIHANDAGFFDFPKPTKSWANYDRFTKTIIADHGYHCFPDLKENGRWWSNKRWTAAKQWTIDNIPHIHRKWCNDVFWFTFERDLIAFMLACK